jgi:hypothetical protein
MNRLEIVKKLFTQAKISNLKYVHNIYYDTYEEALEQGLLEALKLIK